MSLRTDPAMTWMEAPLLCRRPDVMAADSCRSQRSTRHRRRALMVRRLYSQVKTLGSLFVPPPPGLEFGAAVVPPPGLLDASTVWLPPYMLGSPECSFVAADTPVPGLGASLRPAAFVSMQQADEERPGENEAKQDCGNETRECRNEDLTVAKNADQDNLQRIEEVMTEQGRWNEEQACVAMQKSVFFLAECDHRNAKRASSGTAPSRGASNTRMSVFLSIAMELKKQPTATSPYRIIFCARGHPWTRCRRLLTDAPRQYIVPTTESLHLRPLPLSWVWESIQLCADRDGVCTLAQVEAVLCQRIQGEVHSMMPLLDAIVDKGYIVLQGDVIKIVPD